MRPSVLYDYEGEAVEVPDRTRVEIIEAYDYAKKAREHLMNALNALPADHIGIGDIISDMYSRLADDATDMKEMLEEDE